MQVRGPWDGQEARTFRSAAVLMATSGAMPIHVSQLSQTNRLIRIADVTLRMCGSVQPWIVPTQQTDCSWSMSLSGAVSFLSRRAYFLGSWGQWTCRPERQRLRRQGRRQAHEARSRSLPSQSWSPHSDMGPAPRRDSGPDANYFFME